MDNTLTIAGNVTADPELRFLPNGSAVAQFGLAVNRRWKNKAGEMEEESHFFDVTAWRGLAENVAESVVKGMRVVVVGRLQQRRWETDNGDKRSKVEIVADDVAPSLRWAAVTVRRNDRHDGHDGGSRRAEPAYSADEAPF